MKDAPEDGASLSFALRLVHLSLYMFVMLSIGCVLIASPNQRARSVSPMCACLVRRITQLLNTPVAIDLMLVPAKAAQLRTDAITTCLVQQLAVFHIFMGLCTYMLRDQVLDEPKTARLYYVSLISLQFALLAVHWKAQQMGLITESALLLDAFLTALFGGGAALALRFGPSDASTFVAPPTATRLNQSRKAK
jgi:hypothetical protein